MKLISPFLSLMLGSAGLILPASAQDSIEFSGVIDGTDRIVITAESATWVNVSGNLAANSATINGVSWNPAGGDTLLNSGLTAFLTNDVIFASATLRMIQGRDTVVLERSPTGISISIADTPDGPSTYRFVIEFPPIPTLLVEGDIDGSDELHISYSGARWFHKHWSSPANVRLNGIAWNPSAHGFLTNGGSTIFLAEPVSFNSALVLESTGRDLVTLRQDSEGLIINFADDPIGPGRYSVLVGFPPGESKPNASIPVVTKISVGVMNALGLEIETVRGVWYELESAPDINSNRWESTGSFVRGNGGRMTLFDAEGDSAAKLFRVVSREEL